MNIGIYIYELAEELDWAGPWEVLAAWADRADDVHVFTITDTDGPVRCAKGLRVLGDHTWETAPELDVLVVPGGDSRGPVADEVLIARIRALRERGALLTSVCTGAFVLQAAGALEDKPATTHWGSVERSACTRCRGARRALHRRGRGDHRRGRLGRDRHGAPSRRTAGLGRARA